MDSATTSASSSLETDLSPSPPFWLVDLHSKLWGKRDLFDEIFRTATLTKNDFIELQQQLHTHDPERNSDSYVSKNVIAIKASFLRSKSTAAFAHLDTTSNHDSGLAPKLDFDTTRRDVTPPKTSEVTDSDSSEHLDAMVVDLDYIEKDAIYLSTGETAIFPLTIRYMDLTALNLTYFYSFTTFNAPPK